MKSLLRVSAAAPNPRSLFAQIMRRHQKALPSKLKPRMSPKLPKSMKLRGLLPKLPTT